MSSKDDAVESATKEEQLYYSRTGARELPMTLAETIERLGGKSRPAQGWWPSSWPASRRNAAANR